MYRVITELLTNSMKHGNPGVISLNITRDTHACCFEYSDDGKGFDPVQYHNTPGIKGMGLKNISSRVKSLDGHFHMESAPGNGIRILINIPLK
jgi:signal transduction histidine kinase